MYKLVLIRHGESQWNLENRFTGWTDVDLTYTGIAQAKSAGRALKAGFCIKKAPPPHGCCTGCAGAGLLFSQIGRGTVFRRA